MPLRVEHVAGDEPLAGLLVWAEERAAHENIGLEDLFARALEWERRRVTPGAPRPDYRTKTIGRQGMDARMKPGELHGGMVAELTDVPLGFVQRCAKDGLIESKQPTARGKSAIYDQADALAVSVAWVLAAWADAATMKAAVTVVRASEVVWNRHLFLVVPAGEKPKPVLVTLAGLEPQLGAHEAAFVVNVGRYAARLQDRLRMGQTVAV